MTPTPEQLAIRAGDRITVEQDDGIRINTVCRVAPWQTAAGGWLLQYDGRRGGYLLSRCWPVSVVAWPLSHAQEARRRARRVRDRRRTRRK